MKKIKLLILVEKYLESGYDGLTFVHSRLTEYDPHKFEIKVLSFSANESYFADGIEVLPKSAISATLFSEQDFIVSHAPNLKNHFKYLLKYFTHIKKIVFFFHGHEVLVTSKFYPAPYPFYKRNKLKDWIHYVYDLVKVFILKIIFKTFIKGKKIQFVFVSKWMFDAFIESLRFKPDTKLVKIIPNPVNEVFFRNSYQFEDIKKFDFICIRPLDQSKYAIDLVLEMAKNHPQYNFHIYGKGSLFEYLKPSANVIHHNHFLKHEEMPEVLNQFKAAIMLTRLDAQGVMMCEMANFGIPLVTSDLAICREMLEEFKNIYFVDNSNIQMANLTQFLSKIQPSKIKSIKFEKKNSIQREEAIFTEM